MSPSLVGKVCLVTGCSRGIGKGIALQLGAAGATVYITGRTKGALNECATEIKARGGNPIIVAMDHGNDKDVESLFTKIKQEQNGQLDVLVNNAYAGVNMIMKTSGKKFYETDPAEVWDCINGVGLRGHYLCSVYASRMMVDRQQGLIVNVSSMGGLRYVFNVAYGVGKAALDRMTADTAMELKRQNVTVVSLWPGAVKTETIQEMILDADNANNKMKSIFKDGESVEFAGKSVVHLAADKNILNKSGKILFTYCLGNEYGFKDLDGVLPRDSRCVNKVLEATGWVWLASWIPNFIKIPKPLLHFGSYRF